jgi:hypothetical protein
MRAARLLWMVLPLIAAAALADPSLTPFKTLYIIKGYGLEIGELQSRLSVADDGNYVYQTDTRTTGMLSKLYKDQVSESSTWIEHDGGIRPLVYTYDRSGGKKERNAHLLFNWERGIVRNTIDGDSWQMDIHPGVLDRLVAQIAMMRDLRNGKTDMSYTFADGGKLKTYRFRVVGKERIETPAGEFDSVKIERVRDDNKRATFLWCAPTLNYLPVRIDQREDDNSNFRMLLKEYTGGGQQ